MKNDKPLNKDEYIFIRLGYDLKAKLKKQAALDGSNMTISVRQLVMKYVAKVEP